MWSGLEQESAGTHEDELDCIMINWNLHLSLTTSKAAASVMQWCVQEAGTCGSEAACAVGPGLGEAEGGNLKGSEELLGQLQLQDNRVSELGQWWLCEPQQSKTSHSTSEQKHGYSPSFLSSQAYVVFSGSQPWPRDTAGAGLLRNTNSSLAKLTQYKTTTFSCRHDQFSCKKIIWKYVKEMIPWTFTHLFFPIHCMIMSQSTRQTVVYSNISQERKIKMQFFFFFLLYMQSFIFYVRQVKMIKLID